MAFSFFYRGLKQIAKDFGRTISTIDLPLFLPIVRLKSCDDRVAQCDGGRRLLRLGELFAFGHQLPEVRVLIRIGFRQCGIVQGQVDNKTEETRPD